MLYRASSPKNTTLGASIQPVLAAMDDSVQEILVRHNLDKIDPDTWYPQQDYLNVYNDIFESRNNVMSNLVAIGIDLLDKAAFPPEITTIEQALSAMDAYYHLNNKDEDGGWHVEIEGKSARCVSTTPFPADFEYGILFAMTRRFLPRGTRFSVAYEDASMKDQKKDHNNPCAFLVKW